MDGLVSLYDRDFIAWTEVQAGRLRAAAAARVNADVDWENVAEEIEDLGKSTARELRNRLATIVEHLLTLRHSPAPDPRERWMTTVRRERRAVADLLEESPSLRSRLPDMLPRAARAGSADAVEALRSRGEAVPEAGEAEGWDEARVLGSWWPEAGA